MDMQTTIDNDGELLIYISFNIHPGLINQINPQFAHWGFLKEIIWNIIILGTFI